MFLSYFVNNTTSLHLGKNALLNADNFRPRPALTFSPPLSLPMLNTSLTAGERESGMNGEIGVTYIHCHV